MSALDLSIGKVLKWAELNFPKVTIRAIQDYIVDFGDPDQKFGPGNVKEHLYLGLTASGYEFHNSKKSHMIAL